MKSLFKANSEYLKTPKDQNPFLCKCSASKKYFVSVFFSKEYIEKKGFEIIK